MKRGSELLQSLLVMLLPPACIALLWERDGYVVALSVG